MMKREAFSRNILAWLRTLLMPIWRHSAVGLVVALCVAGTAARLAPIAASRFHPDEAIYGYWALQVVTGQDDWLSGYPVDKPPLHIYTLALFMRCFGPSETAARLPGELSSAASLVMLYLLGKRLYGHRTALTALALAAFSPFNISFAPTAFTDPMMVAWVWGASLAAVYCRWGWAGWLLGLGVITKPQAALFLPLVIAIGLLGTDHVVKPARSALRFALGLIGALAPAVAWDLLRAPHAGFLQQSLISYGGLKWAPAVSWPERCYEWGQLMGYFTGSRLLNTALVIGLPVLLVYALFRWPVEKTRRLDWLLALFVAGFVAIHTVLEFNVWDRYLLGLVPVLLLLLARALNWPADMCQTYQICQKRAPRWPGLQSIYSVGLAALLVVSLFRPVQDAASNRYPIGGARGAYNGLDALVNYMRGNVPGAAVVYHHWLGWHYSFYLFGFPYRFQWYTTPDELTQDALARPGAPRYVAFPSWRSATSYRWSLEHAGLELSPIYETYRDDGSRSFTLYRIEEADSHD